MYPRKDTRSGRDTYRCRGRDDRTTDCTMPPLPRAEIDGRVRDYIAGQVLSPGMAEGEISREAEIAAKEAAKVAAAAEREVTKIDGEIRNGKRRMLEDEPPFGPTEWREFKAELEAQRTTAAAKAAHYRQVAQDLKRPSGDLTAAVEAIRSAAAQEAAADTPTLAAQQVAIGRLFECFEVLTGPVDVPVADVDDDANRQLAEAVVEHDRARRTANKGKPAIPPRKHKYPREYVTVTSPPFDVDDAVAALAEVRDHHAREVPEPDVPPFKVKARGHDERLIYLLPMPRPEVAERFGATPLDSLRELDLSVRKGLPLRYASGPS